MSSSPETPVCSGREHDGDGRLVAINFNSTPFLSSTATNPWLVAIDGSDTALRAIRHAVSQARTTRPRSLHLINVQPWLSKEAAESELAQRGLEATSHARAALDAACLSWQLHVVMGEPSTCILERAAHLQVEGIIMGTRGLSAVEGVLLGSVAYKVLHRAKVPVMMVP